MAEDQTKDRVQTEVRSAAKDKVSRTLIQNWKKLRIIMPELPEQPPKAAEFMGDPTSSDPAKKEGIAGALISKGEAKIGSTTLKLTDLSKRIDETTKGSTDPAMVALRESVASFPNDKMLEEITEASVRGIKNQSGMGNTFLNFLSAVMTWIGSLIGSMFGGEPAMSFSEAMASNAAPGIRESVHTQLQALADDPSKASSRLLNMQDETGHTAVDAIANKAFSAVYTELGVKAPAFPGQQAEVPLDQVKPEPIDMGGIRTTISQQIRNPAPGPDGKPTPTLSSQIFDILKESRDKAEKEFPVPLPKWLPMRSRLIPDDGMLKNDADTMAKSVADTIVNRLSNPTSPVDGKKWSELSPEAFSKAMADEVGKELEKLNTSVKIGDKMPDMKARIAAQLSGRFTELQLAAKTLENAASQKPAAPAPQPAAPAPAVDVRKEATVTSTLNSMFDITEAQEMKNIPGVRFFNKDAPAGTDPYQTNKDFGKTAADSPAKPITPESVTRISMTVEGESEPRYYRKIVQNGATGDDIKGVTNDKVDKDGDNKGFKGVAWVRTDKEGKPLLVKGEAEVQLSFAGYKSKPRDLDSQQTRFALAMEQGRLTETVSQVPAFMARVREELAREKVTAYNTHIGAHSMGSANAQAAGAIAEATGMKPVSSVLMDPVTASLANKRLREPDTLRMLGITEQQVDDALAKTTSIRSVSLAQGQARLSNSAMLKVIDPSIPLPAGAPETKQRTDAIHLENMGPGGTGLFGIASRGRDNNAPDRVDDNNRTVGTEIVMYMDVDKVRAANPLVSAAAVADPAHALSNMVYALTTNSSMAPSVEKLKTAVLLAGFDANKDGSLVQKEVEDGLAKLRAADTDKDGKLSTTELAAIAAADKAGIQSLALADSILKANKIDTQKASITDVMAALKTLGVQVTDPAARSAPPTGGPAGGTDKGNSR